MPTPIDLASAEKIAAQHARSGKPLPAAMQGHPKLRAAYAAAGGKQTEPDRKADDDGSTPTQEDRTPARRERPVRQKQEPPTPVAAPQPSRPARATNRAGRAGGGYATRAFSPRAAAGRVAQSRPGRAIRRTVGAGDSGGLLLAIVVYPVVLATFKYGASGPGDWFRAKWLNQPTGTPAKGLAKGLGRAIAGAGVGTAPHPQQHRQPRAHRHPGQTQPRRGHH